MTKRRIKNNGPTGFNTGLGKTLAKHRPRTHLANPNVAEPEEPKKVLASVTQESNLEEFLHTAELAGTTFEAEREDFRILSRHESHLVKMEDLKAHSLEELTQKYGHLLRIPRRPPSNSYSTAEELNAAENEVFLEWRKSLAALTEGNGVVVTPFERNPELWRQLWRVIERSNILVQIVDARNPLLFRSIDLEKYVKEVDNTNINVILINKADLLTPEQISAWHNYFNKQGINALFWSAVSESTIPKDNESITEEEIHKMTLNPTAPNTIPYVQSPQELMAHFKALRREHFPHLKSIVIGMVGYPNVGKSSTINSLLADKCNANKASVSATPGKTKHFQTLIIDEELTLCDSPGLVMPSFGFSNSEMILNGILPIDNMKDYYSPIQLLINRVPRQQIEALYSILLPKPASHEPSTRPPTAHEALTTLAFMRGYMSAKGIPDCSRSARLILKDVVNGKMKWVAAPPGISQETFDAITFAATPPNKGDSASGAVLLERLGRRNLLEGARSTASKLDKTFFDSVGPKAHITQVVYVSANGLPSDKKHGNKGKKMKLRKRFAHLDA